MIPLIIIGAIALVPVLLALILRVHALFLFVAISAGYFLQFAISDDVDLAFATVIKGSNSMIFAQFTLLALPVLLTFLMLRKTAGKSTLLQLVPLLLSGLLLATISLPLLPTATEQAIYATNYGGSIRGAQDLILAVSALANVGLMVLLFRHDQAHSKH